MKPFGSKIKIFIACHKKIPVLKTRIFTPIQTGRANSPFNLHMIGDDTGDNISYKDKHYAELTVHYWVWKNIPKDIEWVGFFHYRRYLNMAASIYSPDAFFKSNRASCKKFGWYDKYILNFCKDYDIILPRAFNDLFVNTRNNYEQYCKYHIQKDLDLLIETVKKKYPSYSNSIDKVMNSETIHFHNIFIMKREIFDNYMEFLFSILFEMENKIDLRDPIYNPPSYQKRVLAFMGERLLDIYLERLKETESNLRIRELPVMRLIIIK